MSESTGMRFSARVAWSEEDEAYVAFCPEFQGVSALGPSRTEAVRELNQALELAVETHEAEGWPVPEPVHQPQFSGQFRLRIPKSLHAWLADYAQQAGVSLNTLVLAILSRARGAEETANPAPVLNPTKRVTTRAPSG